MGKATVASHLDQQSEALLVLWGAASCSGVLPVQVEPVKAVRPQELDGRLDKSVAVRFRGTHDAEPGTERERVYREAISID